VADFEVRDDVCKHDVPTDTNCCDGCAYEREKEQTADLASLRERAERAEAQCDIAQNDATEVLAKYNAARDDRDRLRAELGQTQRDLGCVRYCAKWGHPYEKRTPEGGCTKCGTDKVECAELDEARRCQHQAEDASLDCTLPVDESGSVK
jgi:hypothetical protein